MNAFISNSSARKIRPARVARPYFWLIQRNHETAQGQAAPYWSIEFGSYDRDDVASELEDYRDHGVRKADLKIVRAASSMSIRSCRAVVASLNASEQVVA